MVTTSRGESGTGSGGFEPAPLSENARVVIERRIAKRNDRGDALETPDECFRRVARNLAEAEVKFGGPPRRASTG
jgi:ribonucleoside-diphosphate reductase alpha chain